MEQDKVNMIILALLAVNIILGLICVFKKGASEEEEEFRVIRRSALNANATTMAPAMKTMAPAMTMSPTTFVRR